MPPRWPKVAFARAAGVDIEQPISDFERRLRKKLVEEVGLVALAERHREITEGFKLARRLLPIVDAGSGSGSIGRRQEGEAHDAYPR